MTGVLAGIARHPRPRAPMEVLDHVAVTRSEGIHGDFRGAVRPGKPPRRQVTLIERESWEAALGELGADVPWQERRANLLVSGIRLPREKGKRVAIGASLVIEVTRECDPCHRMEEIAEGLKAALTPDWRGGVCGFVVSEGEIAVGNSVRIEE